MIINLPATVEMTTPNVFADEVEYVSTHLQDRDSVVLSLHPHNDEGMAVAAAELGILAGADRIEGCLLGNGERTGNVDLVTLGPEHAHAGHRSADRLLERARDPQDRRVLQPDQDLQRASPVRGATSCSPRSPGSRIRTPSRRALRPVRWRPTARAAPTWDSFVWLVPYLPIDPKDVGGSYEAIIRVNSQSGKGGMAYLLKTNHNLDLPKRLQVEFDKIVQKYADETKKEVKDADIWRLFKDEYLPVEETGATAAGAIVGDSP